MPHRYRPGGARVLIYSHDSFGLGHLRRCRTIAHHLVRSFPKMSVLILSGSPIIGSFDFPARVDFVRVPGMIKLRDGDYTNLSLLIEPDHTLEIRESIITHTASAFAPDIFIVDKEPLGLRGEVQETLKMLKRQGTRLILGLRDVMDEPAQLAPEWERKKVLPALEYLYDDIWVYGLPQICEPLADILLPKSVTDKITYTGYLPRSVSTHVSSVGEHDGEEPFLLVTTGGGGDGETTVDWVLRAYESGVKLPWPAMVVLGPFMNSARQQEFLDRVDQLANVRAITFDAHMEQLMSRAAGVVAMGGYNTFCEILSFDKPAIIVPRTVPRMEQFIRTQRAESLGLLKMLCADEGVETEKMVSALMDLPNQPRPSLAMIPNMLSGLDKLKELVAPWAVLDHPSQDGAEFYAAE